MMLLEKPTHPYDIQEGDMINHDLLGRVTVACKLWDTRHPGSVDLVMHDEEGRTLREAARLSMDYLVLQPQG